MLSREEAAVEMGMQLSEVVEVIDVPNGTVVETHDGVRTLVTSDGQFLPYTESLAAPAPVDADEDVDLDGDGVPDGAAPGVLTWVGEDSQRAAAALDAERARDKPRSSLITALEKLVSP